MIVVLADDLSGAAELTGIAVRHGLSAELQTAFFPGTGADVVCVATDTRSLPAGHAARIVATVTKEIMAARPSLVFKKCDSVLRGPVLAETRAMAEAAGKARTVILSANPSRGRVIRGGHYFIVDRPLHQTVFAHDPEHPRTSSRVVDLLGGDLKGVEIPDAQTSAEVRRHAAMVDDETLPVGAADFFEALLGLRISRENAGAETDFSPAIRPTPNPGNALLVCGSAAAWSQRRAEALAFNLPVFALPLEIGAIVTAVEKFHRTLIGIGDGPATHGHTPANLVGTLASGVVDILSQTTVTRLLLEGGATAAAVLQALNWTRLRACNLSIEGVGVMQPVNSGPQLFIKPGSYQWTSDIWPATNPIEDRTID